MVDKELIEIWRDSLKPSISLWLLNTNYEEMGEQGKEEFERDFDEILDLALIGLKYKTQLSQERTEKRTETRACELISRQAAIDAVNNAFDRETLLTGFVRSIAVGAIRDMLSAQPELKWIPVTERLPDNADHPEAFCPRYQVTTPYGVTEGWYRPHDHEKGGQWYALFWFMSHRYEIWNIDFERGDVPKVIGEAPVMAWRPFSEAYKEGETT